METELVRLLLGVFVMDLEAVIDLLADDVEL